MKTEKTETGSQTSAKTDPLLRIEELTREFGSFVAVDNATISIEEGEIHSIIGPNGAGKTTLFNMIAGTLPPTSGRIVFEGRDITNADQYHRAQGGISRAFQVTELFPDLTVQENLRLAAQAQQQDFNVLRKPDPALADRARELFTQLGIDASLSTQARNLSHGDKKKLEIGMATIPEPTLLLLDEPTSGVAEGELPALMDFLTGVMDDLTVMLIEHDVGLVLELSDRITVLNRGEVLARGPPDEIIANERVQQAYMGGK